MVALSSLFPSPIYSISHYLSPLYLKLLKKQGLFHNIKREGAGGGVRHYRPVSILLALSNIFKRSVYDQLSKHLDKHNILYKYQSVFRKSYSTETVLIDLSDRIKFSMDKGLYAGMVMIDLQNAFDTVNK